MDNNNSSFGKTNKFGPNWYGKKQDDKRLEVGYIYGGPVENPGEPLDKAEHKTSGFGSSSGFGPRPGQETVTETKRLDSGYMFDGPANSDIDLFSDEKNSVEEYLNALGNYCLSHQDYLPLDCEDIKKGLIEKCNIDERIVNKYITNETYLSFASSMIDESRRNAMIQLLQLYVVPTRKM